MAGGKGWPAGRTGPQARRPRRLRRGAAALPRASWTRRSASWRAGCRRHMRQGPGRHRRVRLRQVLHEEAYLFQKLIRTGSAPTTSTTARGLCHGPRCRPLRGCRLGGGVHHIRDVANADVVIITGSNPTANHPVASSFFKQARRRGTKIIYVDPRPPSSPITPTSSCS